MRVKKGGLITLAPDCRSFGFPCCSQTGRRKGAFQGNTEKEVVSQGNRMALTAMFLFFLALERGCHVIMENPAGSMLFSFLKMHIEALQQVHPECTWFYLDRCAYAKVRPTWKKHFKFLCDSSWLGTAVRTCSCPGERHLPLMDRVEKDGKVQVNGRCTEGDMKKSGQYPAELGEAIVLAWQSAGHRRDCSTCICATKAGRQQAEMPAAARSSAVVQASRPAGLQRRARAPASR